MRLSMSVAICTWNRAGLLSRTLDAMRRMRIPEGVSWEVLVVNNNCTDTTDEVLDGFADSLPVKRVSEKMPGLSHARNAAVANASGEYIVWTDDDVLVDEGWLEAYAWAFREFPEAAVFGGVVEPWFEGQPPPWVEKSWSAVSGAFATRDFGPEVLPLTDERLPFGANFAIRAKEQGSYPYDPRYGLVHGRIILGEETHVMRSIFREGGTGWWIPAAKVRHWIPRSRQTLSYIRKYYAGYGRYLAHRENPLSPPWFKKPRWLWRKALQAEAAYLGARMGSGPEVWMKKLVQASTYWGMIFDKV